ncbi:MAG: outer membrane homotrimeric porin, partial [Bilophila sp.]
MKRIVTLLLAAGLVLGAAAGSQAADIKAKGTWDFMVQFGDQSALKHDGQDTMSAMQRLRTQVDVIASESLKGVMFFEIGSTNWGQSNQGGALGTDGRQVEVRYSYIDWVIPQTEVKVRVGLQNFTLPNFVAGSAILGGGAADGAGITIAGDFTENVGASLFWLRAENDNVGYDSKKDYKASDAFDVVGLTVPLTFDGVKVTPWGMFSMIGKDSLDGNHADSRDQIGTLRTGLTPIGLTSFSSSKDRNGN